MANYTYEELERIANAVRNVWAANYNGGILPGMSSQIYNTGNKAFDALQGDVIEIMGGDLFSGIPLRAIISMRDFGVEEAMRIQDGYGPFDMKPGFLKSPKAKEGKPDKDGKRSKYFIIPFRHMTEAATRPSKKMSPSVHQAAMNNLLTGMKGTSFPEQMGTAQDPSDFGFVNSRGYEWQNGPYAGMVNTAETKEGKKHSQFLTFRVVSEKSDPSSWWHPGVDSNDVIGATVNYVEPYIKEGLKRAAKAEVISKINEIFSHPV